MPRYEYNTKINEINQAQEAIQKGLLTKVFAWMTLGMGVTAGQAALSLSSPSLQVTGSGFMAALVFELIVAMVLIFGINRLPPALARAGFLVYSWLNGITIAPLVGHYLETSPGAVSTASWSRRACLGA
jgi:FtsH-binding integral membrane protein